MDATITHPERTSLRRVFPSWSIEIPASFRETFIEQDGYWHGYDAQRSVSLTSIVVSDDRHPVSAERIECDMRPVVGGDRVDELPDGLRGWAVTASAPASARASRMLTGVVITEGRLLLATITSEDLTWARAIWLSIRLHPTDGAGPSRHRPNVNEPRPGLHRTARRTRTDVRRVGR